MGSQLTDPTITYYPVGNGDTALIELKDRTQVLIDCNIRAPDDELNYPS